MTAMVETNPDYSRQMYEPQYNSHRPPDPPVVTSGLVSESDIRHQERQERLKYELSKEYHDHMQKPSDGFYSDEAPFYIPEKDERTPVYYRREPPEEGLPLGNYAHARRALDEERHREYNRFMHEKEEAARQRREEIMRRQSPTRQPPQSDMYDHNQMSQHLREERRREYNDFLRRQEELELNPQRKPPTPLGGLPVGAYEQQRKRLQAERTREYRDSLLKKENETHNRTPPTPPVGLNIPTEAERLRIAELRKRQYGADLRRQHQEQILNRAQNQVDMPVLDRRNQSPVRDAYNSPSVPPLGLDRRPPSGRWDPESYRQTNYAPVKQGEGPQSRGRQASRGRIPSRENQDSINQPPFLQDRPSSQDRGYVPTMKPSSRELYRPQDRSDYNPDYNPDPSVRLSSPPHQANIGADDYSEYRRKVERDSRNSEYNQFLARKQVEDDARKQKMNEVRRQPAAPVVKGDYYDSESYDLKRQYLMEEKHKEYQNYLKKKGEPFARYDMRNRSDNESPRAKGVDLSVRSDLQDQDSEGDKSPHRSRSNAYYGSTIGALLTGKELNYPNSARQRFLEEKKHAYNEQVKKQGDLQPRKPYNPNGPENRIGFMANLGTSLDRQRESLAHQRHEEYNNFLKDRYALHGKPQGRPSWVDRQVLPDSWYKPSIQRNDDRTSKPRDERPDDRPGSQRRSGTNQSYEDMLQAKRRQEANYRREDYHDYSRPGDRY